MQQNREHMNATEQGKEEKFTYSLISKKKEEKMKFFMPKIT